MRNTKHQMKCLADKLLLALAWFTCCSQHEFIHETSSINLDKKNWTHPSMTCTLPYSMLKDCWVSFKNLYMIGPGLVTFCLPTSNCIFLKEHFACIVLFYVHCCLQPQLSQVQFLQDLFSYKTILNHFTQMTR